MPIPELPFWLFTERCNSLVTRPAPGDHSRVAYTFKSVETLAGFMKAHGQAEWHIHQVTDQESAIVTAGMLQELGVTTICMDPHADGSGGRQIHVWELRAACERLEPA